MASTSNEGTSDDLNRYVIVGGGIAGVSCAEELHQLYPAADIHVISSSSLIKAVTNFRQVSRAMEEFDVKEQDIAHLTQMCPNVTVWNKTVVGFYPTSKLLYMADSTTIAYDKLCICTGAVPKVIVKDHPRVLGIRDTESVEEFQKKLVEARRIVVVGNGGIATELVYEVSGCEVVWAIKDKSIGHTFFDAGAATFFLPHLVHSSSTTHSSTTSAAELATGNLTVVQPLKRTKYTVDSTATVKHSLLPESPSSYVPSPTSSFHPRETCSPIVSPTKPEHSELGSALGPDWHTELRMKGSGFDEHYRHVHVEYECEVANVLTPEEFQSRELTATSLPAEEKNGLQGGSTERHEAMCTVHASDWPVYVELTNGRTFGCDLVVSATGVVPNTLAFANNGTGLELIFAEDGGIMVDSEMRTNIHDVYAAGDVCTVQWDPWPQMWFQMRLWTQARQMGAYAARCMMAHARKEVITPDFCFELFAHVTTFFGYKVVLLGRFNAQELGQDYEILLRCTKGHEYIKVILQNKRMVGAILIGDTDLEETFENLILNQLDLSRFGESLLDPNVDIEDYFD